MKTFISIALAAALLFSPLTQASELFDYVDVAFTKQNPDWSGFEDSNTGTLKASVSVLEWLHVRARYNAGDIGLPSSPGRSPVYQDSWSVLGIGGHYSLNNKTDIFVGTDYNALKLINGSTEYGFYHHLGIKHEFDKAWQLGFEFGQSDVLFTDPVFLIETVYKVSPQFGLSVSLRDYAALDLTEYGVGVRWFFKD